MLTHRLEQLGVAGELKVIGLDQIHNLEVEVPIGLEEVEDTALNVLRKIVCHWSTLLTGFRNVKFATIGLTVAHLVRSIIGILRQVLSIF